MMLSWCVQEAWLSMQTATNGGLRPATPAEERFTIKPIYNTNDSLIQGLKAMWAINTPVQAFATLQKPDVTVTNASDKTEQLPKILKFDERVRGAWKVDNAIEVIGAKASKQDM